MLGYLLNDYEISPSFSGQSGLPYSAGVTGSFNNVVLDNGTRVATTGAITPASTGAGINGTGGTARVPGTDRNIFQYRRALLLDVRLAKRFKVKDRFNVELLGESFNIANHLNQTGVGSTNAYGYTPGAVAGGAVTTANTLTFNNAFGTFSAAPATLSGSSNGNFIYTPRQVQLGARILF